MTDTDRIREQHRIVDTVLTTDTTADMCACGDRWPCDTRIVLDAKGIAGMERLTIERDDARADADRLAEALRNVLFGHPGQTTTYRTKAREALRQHDNHRDTATVEGTSSPDNPTEPKHESGEPTTPTGKRLWELLPNTNARRVTDNDILAIEREAAAAERERLRKRAGQSRTAANISVYLDWLFADPEDTP